MSLKDTPNLHLDKQYEALMIICSVICQFSHAFFDLASCNMQTRFMYRPKVHNVDSNK